MRKTRFLLPLLMAALIVVGCNRSTNQNSNESTHDTIISDTIVVCIDSIVESEIDTIVEIAEVLEPETELEQETEPESEPEPEPEPIVNPYKDQPIFDLPEKLPTYPGGFSALMKYINDNINVTENYTTGTTYVNFIIEPNGMITNVNIYKSSGCSDCDDNALAVVRKMPNWIPGQSPVNTNVRTQYTLPITFK